MNEKLPLRDELEISRLRKRILLCLRIANFSFLGVPLGSKSDREQAKIAANRYAEDINIILWRHENNQKKHE